MISYCLSFIILCIIFIFQIICRIMGFAYSSDSSTKYNLKTDNFYKNIQGGSNSAISGLLAEYETSVPYCEALQILNPKFIIKKIKHPNGFNMSVIDESHLLGGSKQRILAQKMYGLPYNINEIVYAGPRGGYAQIALTYSCGLLNKKCTIFIDAEQNEKAPLTENAKVLGAQIKYFDGSSSDKRLSYIQLKAEKYVAESSNRYLMPFGMFDDESLMLYTKIFSLLHYSIKKPPKRLWVVAGSGLIFTSLSKVFPNTKLMIVQVGKTIWPDQLVGINHEFFISDLPFYTDIQAPYPPYDTLLNYDAKLWPFVIKYGKPDDMIWNTAGAPANIIRIEKKNDAHKVLKSWKDVYLKTCLDLDEAKAISLRKAGTNMKNFDIQDMPYVYPYMKPPETMFKNLIKLTKKQDKLPDNTIVRDFGLNYYESDGLSNHFTERNRMLCTVNSKDKISPFEFWNKYRNKIAFNAFKLGRGHINDFKPDWNDGMRLLPNYKECTTFNPVILIRTIQKYFKTMKIRMLDPSMGWGDRLIGALACNIIEYVGFDPNVKLHDDYDKITMLNKKTKTIFLPERFSINILNDKKIKTNFDLAFTSPPYYNFEVYEGTQSDIKKEYKDWLDDMYIPYLQDMVSAVKKGGYIAVYTSNIYGAPIGDDTKKIIEKTGAQFIEIINFVNNYTNMYGIITKGKPRPLYIFKK